MNMKTIIAAFAVAAATVASAGTFNWTLKVDESSTSYESVKGWTQLGVDYGGWQWIAARDGEKNTLTGTIDSNKYTGSDKHIKFGIKTDKSWAAADTGTIWTSWDKLWESLQGEGATDQSFDLKLNGSGDTVGTITLQAIPEPTSGLMLLLGAGMLALRRKTVRA